MHTYETSHNAIYTQSQILTTNPQNYIFVYLVMHHFPLINKRIHCSVKKCNRMASHLVSK